MQPTLEQSDAIHIHDKNLIVVAGAGSGKTRVLVERYLQLLECNPDWTISALVAITFTREAAFEMRHRLRLELEKRARQGDDGLWARRLVELDRARIDTIHGLCADILRANAAVAGIDPKFEVLDEVEAAIMLGEVVDDMRSSMTTPISKLFAQYDDFRIVEVLNQLDLVNRDLPPLENSPVQLLGRWEREWSNNVMVARERLAQSYESRALDALLLIPADDKLGVLVLQYRAYLLQIKDEQDAAAVLRLLADCHREGAVGGKGSARAWGDKANRDHAAQLLRDLRDQLKDVLKEIGDPPGEIDQAAADVLPLWHQLLQDVGTTYRNRKRARARVDFDDLERLTAELLRDKSVRDRYRNAEFKHLLVDEFQDTNAAQWQIVQALGDLSRGGSLFVVGDPKQSIYQFRGADVSVFNLVRDQIAVRASGHVLPLSMSFRSHQKLVRQFNTLFERILYRDKASPVADYQVDFGLPMSAFRKDSPSYPAIELQLLDKGVRDKSGEYVTEKNGRKRQYGADDMRRWEAWELAAFIKEITSGGRNIFDKTTRKCRPMRFGDVAILFQSMRRVTLYEDVFKTQGLPFLTIAGRGYYDRQEVWDMLDLLNFLHNPADDLSLATVLRSPMFVFSDDLLYALRLISANDAETDAPLPLWRALRVAATRTVTGMIEGDRPLILYAMETLDGLREISGRVTISELLRHTLAKTNYLAILTGLPDGTRRRGNIEKLLQLAQDSGKITLGKFSQYLADLSAREVREGEALLEAGNAVRLTTVHASKGLEFPLVILADASWERGNPGTPILLADPHHGLSCQVYSEETNKLESGFAHRRNLRLAALKEEAERKRLLYVAATRAQDYLLVSGQVTLGGNGWTARGWLRQLLDAFDLPNFGRNPNHRHAFAGDEIAVRMPSAPPSNNELLGSARFADDLWDFPAETDGFPPFEPPLIRPVNATNTAASRHITATQIAWLGTWRNGATRQQRHAYGLRFRESALHDIPSGAHDSSLGKADISPVSLGHIVHELLQYGSFALEDARTDDMIRSIAWGRGLTSAAELAAVRHQVGTLLEQYEVSEVNQWIKSTRADGRAIFTEMPFIFRTEKRVIHGVMDLLLQDAQGEWVVVDYKSSTVARADYASDARRYRLQLGVYASAIKAQFGLENFPRTFVHYLQGNRTVQLDSDDCLAELERLESTIGELVAFDA